MKQLKEKEYDGFQQYLYNKVLEAMARMRNEHIYHMTSDKHKKYFIHCLRKDETNLLKDFLYEAIFRTEGNGAASAGYHRKAGTL